MVKERPLSVFLHFDLSILADTDHLAITDRRSSRPIRQQIERHTHPEATLDFEEEVAHHPAVGHTHGVQTFQVQFTYAPEASLAQMHVSKVLPRRQQNGGFPRPQKLAKVALRVILNPHPDVAGKSEALLKRHARQLGVVPEKEARGAQVVGMS